MDSKESYGRECAMNVGRKLGPMFEFYQLW